MPWTKTTQPLTQYSIMSPLYTCNKKGPIKKCTHKLAKKPETSAKGESHVCLCMYGYVCAAALSPSTGWGWVFMPVCCWIHRRKLRNPLGPRLNWVLGTVLWKLIWIHKPSPPLSRAEQRRREIEGDTELARLALNSHYSSPGSTSCHIFHINLEYENSGLVYLTISESA
jgi:hypothetical protein